MRVIEVTDASGATLFPAPADQVTVSRSDLDNLIDEYLAAQSALASNRDNTLGTTTRPAAEVYASLRRLQNRAPIGKLRKTPLTNYKYAADLSG